MYQILCESVKKCEKRGKTSFKALSKLWLSTSLVIHKLYFHSVIIHYHIARTHRQAKESDVTPVKTGLAVTYRILGN